MLRRDMLKSLVAFVIAPTLPVASTVASTPIPMLPAGAIRCCACWGDEAPRFAIYGENRVGRCHCYCRHCGTEWKNYEGPAIVKVAR